MTTLAFLKIAVFFLLVLAVTKPLGLYMRRVFSGERTFLDPVLGPVERLVYRLGGVDAKKEQDWKAYASSLLVFSVLGVLGVTLVERLQHLLPLNPDGLPAVPTALAWNTAVSFVTNTNWQAYAGETTMSHLTQMAALALHNFLSAATGLAIAVAVVRGIARAEAKTIGSFWVDLTRSTLFVLLPISFLAAVVLMSQGVVHSFAPSAKATTLDGATQTIPLGPVASQEAIKLLGTNGGGYFNANSSHPYENPTPATNLLEMFLILAIPAGLTYTLGSMTGKTRHGWAVFWATGLLFLAGAGVAAWAETSGNPIHHAAGVDAAAGNMEGKEVRFGPGDTALFATITTAASCGAVNGMHDSFTPLGGLVPLVNIQLGEVIFGGVGAGLYGVFVFVVLSVFIAGLMVGRTPEYLGKKVEGGEVKLAMLSVLILTFCILVGTAAAVSTEAGRASLSSSGPHGLSQALYAFTSAAGNNGSAFAGLNANTGFYNLLLGASMFFGRFLMIVPVLAMAGSLAAKKRQAETAGTFPVDGPLFTLLLAGVILVLGALTFFPVLSLGPIVEHLLMAAGR
ncbi:MAG: potassium-transporting ATPase subunit KdpA, partial [Thermoanaerobaculia bacterium]|nr:potassium-transporting ATPase subunit KdpA [Thermoanaerobaculia bacterium]